MNIYHGTIIPCLLAVGVASAAPGGASPKPLQAPLSQANLMDTGVGLIIVLVLIIALAWLVKRYMQIPGMGKGQVQIIGGVSLGPRERAVLISVDGTRLLLGVAPGRVQTLHVLAADQSPPEDDAFAGHLAQLQETEGQ